MYTHKNIHTYIHTYLRTYIYTLHTDRKTQIDRQTDRENKEGRRVIKDFSKGRGDPRRGRIIWKGRINNLCELLFSKVKIFALLL